jgi:hypothetical protein
MATAPVLNSGFIGGGTEPMLQLIARMAKEVGRFEKCSDQGALNWLYHTGRLAAASPTSVADAPVAVVPTPDPTDNMNIAVVKRTVETGPVLHTLETVCTEAAAEYPVGRDLMGRLKNLHRTDSVAVVHQWTRCQTLIALMFAQYPYHGPWRFPGVM